MHDTDVLMVGAGAAGLFCAGVAAQLGLKVLLIDHSAKVAEKIRISGGGRSNFTNRDIDVRAPHRHFLGENPQFCRSALSRYTPADFIALVQRHGIAFHEKHKGQLFCDHSAEDLIQMLLKECAAGANGGSVTRWQPCGLKALRHHDSPEPHYEADTDQGTVRARAVVIATGGLSIPQIGASDLGYRLATQFGLRMVTPRPALVPLSFDAQAWAPFAQLAGLSLPVTLATGAKKTRMAFDEDLLFTHRGLSGPAVLQISSYWQPGQALSVDLAPGVDLAEALVQAKHQSRRLLANALATWFPARLAEQLSQWQITPTGTEGYKKAEVTAGGVDTRDLSQQTLESRQPGLYFIGEVVDVTGWLGGYNFQWAWASAHACAQALPLPAAV